MLRAQRYLRGNSAFAFCTTTTIALLMIVLSACGSNSSNMGSQGPNPTPTLQVQHCGTLHSLRFQIVPADQNIAKQAENCFWQAFQQCQPATLTYTQSGIDTGTVHTFSLKSINGMCSISDGVQHFIAPNPPGAAKTYTCSDVKLQSDGLHILSCGAVGTVLIPMS